MTQPIQVWLQSCFMRSLEYSSAHLLALRLHTAHCVTKLVQLTSSSVFYWVCCGETLGGFVLCGSSATVMENVSCLCVDVQPYCLMLCFRRQPPCHQSQALQPSCALRMLRPSSLWPACLASLVLRPLQLRPAEQFQLNSAARQMCSDTPCLSIHSLHSLLSL